MENLREFTSQDISDLLRALIDREDSQTTGFYTGKVIDNNDPLKEGRCRIKVYGLYDSIPNSDLPWALPDFNFIGSKIGSFVVPPIDAIVRVYFDKDDIYLPHYSTKVSDRSKLSTKRLEDYPDTMILFETDEGDYLTMNRKSRKFVFHHNSGNNVEINKNGDTDILIKRDKTELVENNETHTVIGDHIIKNDNIAYIKVLRDGDLTINGKQLKLDHTVSLEETGKVVVPSTKGPMNCLPTDPLTGLPHAGNICF